MTRTTRGFLCRFERVPRWLPDGRQMAARCELSSPKTQHNPRFLAPLFKGQCLAALLLSFEREFSELLPFSDQFRSRGPRRRRLLARCWCLSGGPGLWRCRLGVWGNILPRRVLRQRIGDTRNFGLVKIRGFALLEAESGIKHMRSG
jgi:hypothetical protein